MSNRTGSFSDAVAVLVQDREEPRHVRTALPSSDDPGSQILQIIRELQQLRELLKSDDVLAPVISLVKSMNEIEKLLPGSAGPARQVAHLLESNQRLRDEQLHTISLIPEHMKGSNLLSGFSNLVSTYRSLLADHENSNIIPLRRSLT
jgi:hypothetical protein